MDFNKMIKFILLGATNAWCAMEVEINVALFMYKEVKLSSHGSSNITLCTDNMLLVHQFQKERTNFIEEVQDELRDYQ